MASSLPANIAMELQKLLTALTAANNEVRSAAEAALNNDWLGKNPDVLMIGLTEQTRFNPEDMARSFAAVLFRRLASKSSPQDATKTIYSVLRSSPRSQIKQNLLEAFRSESSDPIRHKISDAVAEIGRYTVGSKDTWPELLQALFHASRSEVDGQRESAFRIFSSIPEIIGSQHLDNVKQVKIAAVQAFAAFYETGGKNTKTNLQSLMPSVLNVLPPLHEARDSEALSTCLGSLIELAEVSIRAFKPFFSTVVGFGISIIKDKDLESTTRQTALELLTAFAESAPNTCRKDPSCVTDMVTQCLSLMTDVGVDDDDAEEWNASDDLDLDESDANHVAGEQAMDRLALKLGGKALLPPTFQWLPQMVSSSHWRERHAALMALSAIAEGCEDLMRVELSKVLDMIIPLLQDPHPRVRWAACNAIGQMSTDFADTIQKRYHSIILPALIPVLKSPEPRVQAHAAAALVNFCEEASKDVIEPYLDALLDHLHHLLQSPKMYVQEQAVTTIATVADAAETKFLKYYDAFMPLLLGVLRQATDKEYRLLRAKAMECATLIALAVGKEKFAPTASKLIPLLGSIQSAVTEPDDPQASYLVQAWGRICRVIGDDFVPYLDHVIPPLLESAKITPQVAFPDVDDAAQYENDESWDVLQLKGRQIAIQTSSLEDKLTAVEMLVCYASQLQAAFDRYVPVVLNEVILPSLSFLFHDGVRSAAAKCLPQLLNARKKANPQALPEIWRPALERLLKILQEEALIEVLAEFYECFYECVTAVGPNSLGDADMHAFITATESILQDYVKRLQYRLEHKGEEDEEEEAYLASVEEDADMLSSMNKAFHVIFKLHGQAFLPAWERLLPYYKGFLAQSDPTSKQWAICIFDDLIEFCGTDSFRYQEHFLQSLAVGLTDDDAAVRQAAAYGIGVAAQKGGDPYIEFCVASLPALFHSMEFPGARSEDHVYATENACTSIAKFLHVHGNKVPNADQVIEHWVSTLPVTHDEEAAPYAYMFLNDLVEKKHPAIASRIPFVFDAVAQVLEVGFLSEKMTARTVAVAKILMSGVSPEQGNTILHSMPPERQQAIAPYFS